MAFSYMHISKIKNKPTINKAYEHNYRTMDVPNAVPALKGGNQELISLPYKNGKQMTYMQIWNERLNSLEHYSSGRNVRSNAVLALEVLTSFSREAGDTIDIEKWKEENTKWLTETFNACPEKYGNNVLSVMYHNDEIGNVHCHAFIQPIDNKGRLNASYYTDGRENGISKFQYMQKTYTERMEPLGLERGKVGSKAKHEDIQKFYADLNWAIGKVPLPEKDELATDYYQRFQEGLETIAAATLRKTKEREHSADKWITDKMNSYKEELKLLTENQEKEQRKRVAQADREISKKNKVISQKEAYLSKLNSEIKKIQDQRTDTIVTWTETKTAMAQDILSQFREGTELYEELYRIDSEYTKELAANIQTYYLDHMMDKSMDER